MLHRHRFLIAIEKNELRFWNRAHGAFARLRQSTSLGARVDAELDGAIEWASDAARARREEIAFLTAKAVGAVPASRVVVRPTAASKADAILTA